MQTLAETAGRPDQRARNGRGSAVLLLLLIALHLALTIPLAVILNVWVDESYSLNSTSGSLGEALHNAIWYEKQAPAYFLLLELWRKVDSSPIFARLLSVLFAACTLVVAARISRDVFPGWNPAWLVGFLAFNPVVVWAAVEIRVYPMSILVGAIVLLAFYVAFAIGPSQRRSVLLLILAGGLAVYTQYYLGFLVAVLGLGLAVTGHHRDLTRFGVALAGIVLLSLPIVLWLPDQLEGATGFGVGAFDARASVRYWLHVVSIASIPGYDLLDQVVPMSMYRAAVWVVRVGVAVIAATLLYTTGGTTRLLRNSSAMVAWVCLLGGVGAFAILGFIADSSIVLDSRYWSFLSVPATIAWMSIAWATGRRGVVGVALLLTLGLHTAVLVDTYRPLAKEGDARRVARFLETNERSREPILVFPNELAMPLHLYYSGVNQIVPVPRPVSSQVYDPRNSVISSLEELQRLLDEIERDAAAVWLVQREVTNYRGVSYHIELLDAMVEQRYEITRERRFYDEVTVKRLVPRTAGGERITVSR